MSPVGCAQCGGMMVQLQVAVGREPHYCCYRCEIVTTREIGVTVECPDPIGHCYNLPRWAKAKYAPKTPPLRAHDAKKEAAS